MFVLDEGAQFWKKEIHGWCGCRSGRAKAHGPGCIGAPGKTMKKWIFRIIQPSDGYRPSYVFDWTILGVGLVAIPTGILRAGFVEQFSRSPKATTPPRRCPHCGKELPRD